MYTQDKPTVPMWSYFLRVAGLFVVATAAVLTGDAALGVGELTLAAGAVPFTGT